MKNILFIYALILCSYTIYSSKLQTETQSYFLGQDQFQEFCDDEPIIYEEPDLDGDCLQEGIVKILQNHKRKPIVHEMIPMKPRVQYIPQPIYIPFTNVSHNKKQPVIIINNGNDECIGEKKLKVNEVDDGPAPEIVDETWLNEPVEGEVNQEEISVVEETSNNSDINIVDNLVQEPSTTNLDDESLISEEVVVAESIEEPVTQEFNKLNEEAIEEVLTEEVIPEEFATEDKIDEIPSFPAEDKSGEINISNEGIVTVNNTEELISEDIPFDQEEFLQDS